MRRQIDALRRDYESLVALLNPLLDRITSKGAWSREVFDISDMRRGVNHLHELVRQQGDEFSTRLKRLEDELLRRLLEGDEIKARLARLEDKVWDE
jgi:hypothetical protein